MKRNENVIKCLPRRQDGKSCSDSLGGVHVISRRTWLPPQARPSHPLPLPLPSVSRAPSPHLHFARRVSEGAISRGLPLLSQWPSSPVCNIIYSSSSLSLFCLLLWPAVCATPQGSGFGASPSPSTPAPSAPPAPPPHSLGCTHLRPRRPRHDCPSIGIGVLVARGIGSRRRRRAHGRARLCWEVSPCRPLLPGAALGSPAATIRLPRTPTTLLPSRRRRTAEAAAAAAASERSPCTLCCGRCLVRRRPRPLARCHFITTTAAQQQRKLLLLRHRGRRRRRGGRRPLCGGDGRRAA